MYVSDSILINRILQSTDNLFDNIPFCSEGALLQTNGFEKRSLVVSTLVEAEMFADSGHFQDILYGYPLTADKIERLDAN